MLNFKVTTIKTMPRGETGAQDVMNRLNAKKAASTQAFQVGSVDQTVIDSLRSEYEAYIKGLTNDLGETPMFFTPNAPKVEESETKADPALDEAVADEAYNAFVKADESPVNGISVGEEAGESLVLTVKKSRKKKAVQVEDTASEEA